MFGQTFIASVSSSRTAAKISNLRRCIIPLFQVLKDIGIVKLGYRYQWTGFGSDAPKFINASFNFRLKEPLDLTLNALRTSMAKSQNNEIPKIKRVIHGLGVNIFQEQFGLIKKFGGGINYSFHYPITKQMRLALGLGAMVENTKIDLNGIYFGIDPNDPNKGPLIQNPIRCINSLLSTGSAQPT